MPLARDDNYEAPTELVTSIKENFTESNYQGPGPMIIFHGPGCFDGFCSAWIYSKWWTRNAEFVPATYGDAPPNVTGRDVMIVDFSYPAPILEAMRKASASMIVLDHHKTAQADLEGLEYCRFDMTKSGAHLLWETKFDTKPHWLVEYTEDRDLWIWKLPDSKAVNAAIRSYPMTFETWDMLSNKTPEELAEEGMAILRAEFQTVMQHVERAVETTILGHKVWCVNATVLQSEIGHALATDRPFSATFFVDADGEPVWSLRSVDGGEDVSEIARHFGGGGHKHAAGFRGQRCLSRGNIQ